LAGAHGLDIEKRAGYAFVACDGKAVLVLDVDAGKEIGSVPIAGNSMQFGMINGESGYIGQLGGLEDAQTTAFDLTTERFNVFFPGSCRASVYEEV